MFFVFLYALITIKHRLYLHLLDSEKVKLWFGLAVNLATATGVSLSVIPEALIYVQWNLSKRPLAYTDNLFK